MSKKPALLALFTLLAVAAVPLPAQVGQTGAWVPDISVNSELERYLRILQVGGVVPLYPWSLRGFSPAELDRFAPIDTAHPWAGRYPLHADTAGGVRVKLIRPESRLIYNSAFPYGYNDGAVWAGRGITAVMQAGLIARYGPVSLQVAPIAFWAQNRHFDLVPNRLTGRRAFADPISPGNIDLPQRFGDEAYGRVDLGQSFLRVDLRGATMGVSTANQQWGPALQHPVVLGNNAAGFPHAYVGTSSPVSIGIGRVHGRLVWGRLGQSEYSSVGGTDATRFMAGAVGIFTPRGIDGLEVGVARFYHMPWDSLGRRALKPLESFTKINLPVMHGSVDDNRTDRANQIASVFARWIVPNSGMEIYGEFGREDHNWDFGDFILQPDHISAYTIGFQKHLRWFAPQFISVRGEVMNSLQTHIAQERPQSPFYWHGIIRQGHTQRGQLLGSGAGYSGGGSVLAADAYNESGRWTLEWSRTRVHEAGRLIIPRADSRASGVMHSLGAEVLWFRGPVDLQGGMRVVYNLSQYFASNAVGFNANLGMRLGF